jgi:hypothetical protein
MIALITLTLAIVAAGTGFKPPHMDLEMSGVEYRRLLNSQSLLSFDEAPVFDVNNLNQILKVGTTNLDWLKLINENRQVPINLTRPEELNGYPIDKPSRYNPEMILASYNEWASDVPKAFLDVVTRKAPMPIAPPFEDEEYRFWARRLDGVYQTAARWKMMEPYLDYLRERVVQDIRGYYFLKDLPERNEKFARFSELPVAEQDSIRGWLIGMCRNSRKSLRSCERDVNSAIGSSQLPALYSRFEPQSRQIFESFFRIPSGGRSDLFRWGESLVRFPLLDRAEPKFLEFFTVNVENEWRWQDWRLEVSLVSRDGLIVHWVPGVTPHVPGLGSNEIYMDANASLDNWDTQWTIRHEFGHNLGFPDCYVEFYDEVDRVIINYQIDTSDLMCSRRGKLKARHMDELKRTYD